MVGLGLAFAESGIRVLVFAECRSFITRLGGFGVSYTILKKD